MMERRTFIAGAATIPIAGATQAAPTDPLVALWAEHQRIEAAWEHEVETNPDARNWDTPKCFRLEAEQNDIGIIIGAEIATTPDGLVAQLEFAIDQNWSPDEGEFGAQLFASILTGAKQLTA